jgi:hypothetical protein
MQSGMRIPLEVGSLDPSGKHRSTTKKKKKKLVRFPREDCEFYINIWNPPTSAAAVNSESLKNARFIDIVQVAYALVRMDYKSDYDGAAKVVDGDNIWSGESGPETAQDSTAIQADDLRESSVRRILSQQSNRSNQLPSEFKTLERLLSSQGASNAQSLPVAPPTKHDDGRFIFSAVLSQLELRDRWSSKFLLGLHEPMRHALYVIDRFLERAQSKDPESSDWNTATFFAWFADYFCEYLQAQQRIKANVLRPLVHVKYAAKREIAECYEEIIFMMNAIMMQEELFPMTAASAVQSWQRRVQTLQEDIRKLNVVIYHVLNLEERALQPALIATFNEETFYKFVMPRVYGCARPKRLVIPWIIERTKVWGNKNDVSMFKKQLSFPSRFLYDRIWYPHFVRHVVAAMKVLDTSLTEMPSEATEESWLGCMIQ